MEAEQNFLKNAQSPEDRDRRIELLTEDLKQTRETLSLQTEGIERMQQMLQSKDDEIDKLREALDDEDENSPVSENNHNLLRETSLGSYHWHYFCVGIII